MMQYLTQLWWLIIMHYLTQLWLWCNTKGRHQINNDESSVKVLKIGCAEDSEADWDSGEHETDKTKKAPPYGGGGPN